MATGHKMDGQSDTSQRYKPSRHRLSNRLQRESEEKWPKPVTNAEDKNTWRNFLNVKCVFVNGVLFTTLPFIRKQNSPMKVCTVLEEMQIRVLTAQEVQQPDSTPPRGGNRVSDKISPDPISFVHATAFLIGVCKATKLAELRILFDCYTLAQTTGLMNNYLVPEALNCYGVHI